MSFISPQHRHLWEHIVAANRQRVANHPRVLQAATRYVKPWFGVATNLFEQLILPWLRPLPPPERNPFSPMTRTPVEWPDFRATVDGRHNYFVCSACHAGGRPYGGCVCDAHIVFLCDREGGQRVGEAGRITVALVPVCPICY